MEKQLKITREMLRCLIDEMDADGIREGQLQISEWTDRPGYVCLWIKESENVERTLGLENV